MSASAPRALQRGLQLCELLSQHPEGLGFAALATSLGTADSATHRLLLGLQELGYVGKNSDGRYVAGAGLRRLHVSENRFDSLVRIAAPFVRRLQERTANTSLLIANTGDHMLILDRCEHENSMAFQAVGQLADNFRYPPWGWLFKSLKELSQTRTNRPPPPAMQWIRDQLRGLPERGWVIRLQDDRRRLAAPLRDANGETFAALAVGGTPSSLPDTAIETVGDELRRITASCQQLLV